MFQTFEMPKAEEFIASFQSLNALAMSNMERLVTLQTRNYEKYSTLAIANVREAAAIRDLEQSRDFIEKQFDISRQCAEELTADATEVAEMGKAYAAEVQKLLTANVEKAVQNAEAAIIEATPVTKAKKAA